MPVDSSAASSSSSMSSHRAGLFPSLRGASRHTKVVSGEASESGDGAVRVSESSSRDKERENESSIDIGSPYELFQPQSVAEDASTTGDMYPDEELDLSTSSHLGVDLKEDVMKKMAELRPQNSSEYVAKDPKNKKFKYLDMYEDMAGSGTRSDSSLFDLSALDDFNQYVKRAEINDYIQQQLRRDQLKRDENMLSIVQPSDLAQNFYSYGTDESASSPSRNGFKFKYPWNNTAADREKRVQNDSDVSELRVAGDSVDSNTTDGHSRFLERKLEVRHLQMISFGGTLGVGLFLNCGKAFTIAGGFGTVLAFIIVGVIVLATLVSFCEMVTFVSVVDGVSGLSSRFVDEAFGFATGWLYFLSFALGLAGEIVAAVILLSYFPDLEITRSKGSVVGFVTLFLLFCLLSNLFDVRVFGEIEYWSSVIKMIVTLIMIIVMIIINRGGLGSQGTVGFKYWQRSESDFEHNLIFGLFRPTFDLQDNGMNGETEGIGGDLGRFMSLLTAIVIASYSYSGTEIVCVAACEAKNPRKALPSATRRVFWRILIFYVIAVFVVSLNIYAGDPRLLRYYSGTSGVNPSTFNDNYAVKYVGGNNCHLPAEVIGGVANGSQSPWTVAFQSVGLCDWSAVQNGFLVFFALSCGNAQLYVSSRTVYSLALQRKAPAILMNCNRFGIPYYAVLLSFIFGLLAFTCVSESSTSVFQNLTSVISSSGVFVWFAICLSFIRFYYGLRKRPDIIDRNDKSYPYKSPFQPYSAIVGLIGSAVILLAMGYVVFLDGQWDIMFFFSSYGTLILVLLLYLGYKVIKGTRILSLEALDYDSGRREHDIYIWDGGKEHNVRNLKEWPRRVLNTLA
ncbi:hypothetical protein FT663_00749 [Candidozyma haemuli var. vulneris]|uniref:Amino acid permease/ SLC12A domain-containing protein n=1 Tax=Candidozyma haemuli TaxID=45357 RepID=A0A2V1APJ3_9ASCO|nr:hypothetical protein CXQ85_003657 [[Candida] haemuloni]KAF3992469.1 hypothetical protein FT662_01178 [[Candida] haemuloni var. vulneris]KAF3995206.1 hypothetical protein FT663_00749 [[Candida] haemuloni var. vulneris]PVH19799.1 hypothetical protein CXQ85_003657 [[Candida] haemuloni]